MIKHYLAIIFGTGMLSPMLYIFFKMEGFDPMKSCLAIFIPAWIVGILLFNFLENGHGLDFRDRKV